MSVTKEEIYGFSVSSIFCLLMAILLYITYIETVIKPREEGVLVNFGNVNSSTGTFEPRSGAPQGGGGNGQVPVQQPVQTPPQQSVQRPAQTQRNTQTQRPAQTQRNNQTHRPATQPRTQNNSQPVITQNLENTAAVETARREQEARETARRVQEEKDRIAAAELQAQREAQQKRDAINQQISGAFGSGASGSNQQGSGAYGTDPNGQNQRGTGTSGTGVQGDPRGTTQAGSPTGTGYGEFNLGGRTLRGAGGLPRPDYSAQEEGRIVINITVNPSGDVIYADINLRSTNIENTDLRRSALDAARKAKFDKITGSNNQSGTITYHYKLK